MSLMNIKLCADSVEQFHELFEYRFPTPMAPDMPGDVVEQRWKLMKEEYAESRAAWLALDRRELLDGLLDFQYVLSGTVLALGFKSTFPFDCESLHFSSTQAGELAGFNMMEAKLFTFKIMAEAGNVIEASKALVLMQQIAAGLVISFGFEACFDEAFEAVHANNLSKLWRQDQLKDAKPDWTRKLKPGYGYIVRDENRKIRKPSGHVKVDLSRFA